MESTNVESTDVAVLPMPPQFATYDGPTKDLVLLYLQELNEKERKAYVIAMNHLGSSFNLLKSNGYLEWYKHLCDCANST